MYKKVSYIIIMVMMVTIMLSACSKNNIETNIESDVVKSDIDYKAILDNAKEIKIQEAIISLGKRYKIYVDNKQVAEINGKIFNGFGDTFTLTDQNGNFIIKEQEYKRWGKLNRTAAIMDKDDKILGYIGETVATKFFSIGYTFHFFDKEQNQVGISDQVNFSLFKKNKFYDNDKNLDYNVEQKVSVGDTYILSVKDTSNIPLYHAILMVCIEDAIKDSEENDKKSSSKSKH